MRQQSDIMRNPVVWHGFLRGLAIELESQAGSAMSQAILRNVGLRMAGQIVLVAVDSLEALEMEMNAALSEIGWGSMQATLEEAERCIIIVHRGLPRIGSAGNPPGAWLTPVLEGLYEGWMSQQPDAAEDLRAEAREYHTDQIVIRYGR